MSRPLNDSPYLYGLHDPGGEHIMADQGILGWILFTEELGNDPERPARRRLQPVGRPGLRHHRPAEQRVRAPTAPSRSPTVTPNLPRRCANFVRNSRGCHIWIIGNEMNFAVERPGVEFDRGQNPPRLVRPGEVIQPGMYANCYRQCRAAIKGLPDTKRTR